MPYDMPERMIIDRLSNSFSKVVPSRYSLICSLHRHRTLFTALEPSGSISEVIMVGDYTLRMYVRYACKPATTLLHACVIRLTIKFSNVLTHRLTAVAIIAVELIACSETIQQKTSSHRTASGTSFSLSQKAWNGHK